MASSSSTVKVEVAEVIHELCLTNVGRAGLTAGECIRSGVFRAHDTAFFVELYPRGVLDSPSHVAVFLTHAGVARARQVRASFTFSMVCSEGGSAHEADEPETRDFEGEVVSWGFQRFLPLARFTREFHPSRSCLTVRCSIRLLVDVVGSLKVPGLAVETYSPLFCPKGRPAGPSLPSCTPHALGEHDARALIPVDVVLHCAQGAQVGAHRLLFCQASPVFRAKERRESCQSGSAGKLLDWRHVPQNAAAAFVQAMSETAFSGGLVCSPPDPATAPWVAALADLYDVPRARLASEQALLGTLSAQSLASLLVLSVTLDSLTRLRAAALALCMRPDVYPAFRRSVAFRRILCRCPAAAEALLDYRRGGPPPPTGPLMPLCAGNAGLGGDEDEDEGYDPEKLQERACLDWALLAASTSMQGGMAPSSGPSLMDVDVHYATVEIDWGASSGDLDRLQKLVDSTDPLLLTAAVLLVSTCDPVSVAAASVESVQAGEVGRSSRCGRAATRYNQCKVRDEDEEDEEDEGEGDAVVGGGGEGSAGADDNQATAADEPAAKGGVDSSCHPPWTRYCSRGRYVAPRPSAPVTVLPSPVPRPIE